MKLIRLMKLHVIFKQLNPDYSQEYADGYYFGNESDGNWKDKWRCEFVIKDISSFRVINDSEFIFAAESSDGEKCVFQLPHMTILEVASALDNTTQIAAVSTSLLDRIHAVQSKEHDITRFYFYFKNTDEFVHILQTVYVATRDLPEEITSIE